jgi:Tol biopolymer transport system component
VAPLTTFSPPAPVLARTGPIGTPTFVSTPTLPSATDAKQKIAAICGSDVYAINVDGSGLTNLTSHIAQHGPPWGLPVWSPDGSRVAITLVTGSDSEIYVVKADGSESINVTNNPATDMGPTWSPDGSQLAFVSNRDGVNLAQIYKMNSDGSGLTKASDGSSFDVEPVWSPDGTKIAFLSGMGEQARYLFVMKSDGSDRTQLTGPQIYHPAWLPDSRKIVFLAPLSGSGAEIGLTSVDDAKLASILTLEFWPGTAWPYFVVSPDGKRVGLQGTIAAYLDGSGAIQFDNTNWELYTDNASRQGVSGWSPDLSKIAFFSRSDNQIYSFDVEQSRRTQLTSNLVGECTALVWEPYDRLTTHPPSPSATEESDSYATQAPQSRATPALGPLDRADRESVMNWVVRGIINRDPGAFRELTTNQGLFYANFYEGGQGRTKEQFIDDLVLRFPSGPKCDGISDVGTGLEVWTSGWSPEWQITELCYGNCVTLSAPWKSNNAGFFFSMGNGEWFLKNVYLGTLEGFARSIGIRNYELIPCTQPLSTGTKIEQDYPRPATTAYSCLGALPPRLQIGDHAYVSFDPPLSSRLRNGPGTGFSIASTIPPGKAIEVLDGPVCANNWTWWKVRIIENNLVGWSVEGDRESYWLVPCPSKTECGVP